MAVGYVMQKPKLYLLAFTGALLSGVLLLAHAWYFDLADVARADALLWLCLVCCWIFLLRLSGGRTHAEGRSDMSLMQESHDFQVKLGNEIARQLVHAHDEMGNTQIILGEAVSTLLVIFISMAEVVRAQQALFSSLAGEGGESDFANPLMLAACVSKLSERDAIELGRINDEIERQVSVAITTLQFQDISTQLIGHARMRLMALHQVVSRMGDGVDSLTSHAYLEQIAVCKRLLHEHIVLLDERKSSPVIGKGLGAGEIELF